MKTRYFKQNQLKGMPGLTARFGEVWVYYKITDGKVYLNNVTFWQEVSEGPDYFISRVKENGVEEISEEDFFLECL